MKLPLALLLALPLSLSAFDFTVHTSSVATVDGNEHTYYYFRNKGALYRTSDHATDLTGSAAQATFNFRLLQGAQMRLRNCPILKEDSNPRTTPREDYIEAAQQFAPEGAKEISVEAAPCSELEAREIPTMEVTSRYELGGNTIWQSVIFLTLIPKEPMVMITTAYDHDAANARRMAMRMARAFRETTEQELRAAPLH